MQIELAPKYYDGIELEQKHIIPELPFCLTDSPQPQNIKLTMI